MHYHSICGENGERQGKERGKQRGKIGVLLLFCLQIWDYCQSNLYFVAKVPIFRHFSVCLVVLFSAKNDKNKIPQNALSLHLRGETGKGRGKNGENSGENCYFCGKVGMFFIAFFIS